MLAALAGFGTASPAWADADVPAGAEPATYLWIDRDGKVLKNDWAFEGKWVWSKPSERDTLARPVFRAFVKLPAEIQIESFKATDGRLMLVQDAADSPFSGGGHQLITLDTFSPNTTVRLVYRQKGTPDPIERNLVVNLKPSQTALWFDESCLVEGLRMVPQGTQPLQRQLYVAATCTAENGGLKVAVSWSTDVGLKSATMKKALKTTPAAYEFFLDKPGSDAPATLDVGTLEFSPQGPQAKESRARETNVLTLNWTPRKEAPRLRYVPSLGMSYVSYLETPRNIRITEMGVTGKFLASYRISPSFDASANAFVTLVPIGMNLSGAADLKPARFFGFNGRAGYRIAGDSQKPGNFDLRISGGWYVWGMLVPTLSAASNYGVNFLAGPQLFLSTNGLTRSAGRGWSAYLKFAAISDATFAASLTNRELALGGSYELSRPGREHPIALTLDASDMSVKFTQAVNQIKITTFTLGVSYGL